MTTVNPALVDRTTAAAVEERSKLQRHFGRFDMLFFLVCTLVGLDTIGSVAAKGGQGFTWLAFLGIFFFVPYALLTAELGTAFPEEGGPYIWSRLAFGRLVAGVNAMLYWVSNPIWTGGTLAITAITAYTTFFSNISQGAKYVFAFVFIWFAVISAIMSFKYGKWIPTIGAWCRIAVLGFFTLTVVIYALKHGVHGFGARSFSPSYATFIAVVPVLFFNYVGFELPSAAGEEMKDAQHDVPFAVMRSAVGTLLLYGGPILAILLVLPTSQITNLSGFLTAIKSVFTVYGGHVAKDGTATLTGLGQGLGYVACIAFIAALATSASTWLMGADRTFAVAAYDGCAPRILGRFSARFGTPIVVNFCSGILSTLVMILAFNLTSGDTNRYFNAVLGLAISTTTIAYIVVFPALIKLRYSMPDVPRPYRVPGGMGVVWFVGVLTTFWAVLATIALLYPGFGTSKPDDTLVGLSFAHQRMQYELSQIIPLLAFIALALVLYALGKRTREDIVQVPLASVLDGEVRPSTDSGPAATPVGP